SNRLRNPALLGLFLTSFQEAHDRSSARFATDFICFTSNVSSRFSSNIRSQIVSGTEVAHDRPLPCGTHRRYRRRPSPAEYFLHGPKQRRCLEDNGLWEDVEPYLRRSTNRLDWCVGDCPVQSRRHLCRQW